MIEVLLTSSVLILALALLRRGLRGRIDPRLQYALWLLVVLRLLIPGSLFPAPLTVSGALSDWEASLAADDTVPASAADAPAQSPAAGTPSQPTGADVTALPVLGPLYDVYTEEKDFPLGTVAPGGPRRGLHCQRRGGGSGAGEADRHLQPV